MKTIKNIQNLSVAELFIELNDSVDDIYIPYLDFFNHFRINTNNFEPTQVLHLMADIFYFAQNIKILWNGNVATLRDLFYSDIIFEKYDLRRDPFTKGVGLFGLYQVIIGRNWEISVSDDSEIEPENIKYLKRGSIHIEQYAYVVHQKASELNIEFESGTYRQRNLSAKNYEQEIILPHLKRPQNSHNQQFSILERTGVIDYLKNKYKGITDVILAELIANILNKDSQNTRVKLSLTNTKNQVSNEVKNQDFLKKLFTEIGL